MLSSALDSDADQLDALLELVCVELQLTPTQHDDATRSYMAVGEYLDEESSDLAAFSPEIFAQGSMAIGTTNRPRQGEEFDADLVCLLHEIDPMQTKPSEVYEAVLRRLSESDRYAPKLKPKDRCIRIDYAGQFHLDVIPACPSPRAGAPFGEQALVIPDWDRSIWVPTNPRGYADWFQGRATLLEESRFAASVQPLPARQSVSEKSVLHRVVQLFKRRRDVQFNGGDFAPRSILLTTLDGLLYEGERSLLAAITGTLGRLQAQAVCSEASRPPTVANPTDPKENLARHWREDRRHFTSFVNYVGEFVDGMQRLSAARGTPEIAAILSELFDPQGTGIVRRAVEAYTARFQSSREQQQVRFVPGGGGLVTASAVPHARVIPRNTFFGVDE